MRWNFRQLLPGLGALLFGIGIANAQVDPGTYYYISNNFQGDNKVLQAAAVSGGATSVSLQTKSSAYAQFWTFLPWGDGTYKISPGTLGRAWVLDGAVVDTNVALNIADYGSTSQRWTVTTWNSGGCLRFQNSALGSTRAMDSSATNPFMTAIGSFSGQCWKLTAAGTVPQPAFSTTYVRLKNNNGQYLHMQAGDGGTGGALQVGTIQTDWQSAMWQFESASAPEVVYRIKNRLTGKYLHMEAQDGSTNGTLQAGAIQLGWFSAMWSIKPTSGSDPVSNPVFRLENRWTNKTIEIAGGLPTASIAQIVANQLYFWNFEDVPNCTYSLSSNSVTGPASAGTTSTFTVTAPAGCPWTAVPNVPWLSMATGSSGTGTGTFSITVQANPAITPRSGTVTVAGLTFTVNQAALACTYQVTNTSMTPAPGGATGSSTITAPAGCTWTAVSNVAWVTITSGSSGSGNGTVNYLVAANPNSSQRTGTATVAGRTVNFTQSGSACTYSLSNTSASVAGSGGSGSANVTTAVDCAWSATTSDSWINITAGGSTVGSGAMQFTAQANPNSTPRSGIILIAGQQFAVNQAAGNSTCSYTLSTASGSISANGGTLNVTLTTGPTCTWSISAPDSYVTVTSGLNGTGPATITLNIVSNPGASARNSTITIAGQTFSLSQNGTQSGGISSPLRFVALEPCRVMETRAEYNFQGRTGAFGPPYMRANETRTLTPTASNVCQVPSTAKAYLVNVTLIPRVGVDYVTLYPTGEGRPQFYSVRSPDGQIVANSAIVKAGANGGVDVFASNDTDMIIDIAGYFTDNANVSNLVFYPLTPCRVVDSRSDYRAASGAYGPPSMNQRETRRVRFPGTPFCSIPNGAAAYSMTITAVPQGPLQYLTAWPSGGAQPNVSSINSPAGRVLANSVILPASSDGSIDVFTFDRTDFLIDINGYFAPDDGSTGLYYYPVTQCRAADSTSSSLPGAFGAPIYQSEIVRTLNIPTSPGCSSIPSTAKAYVVNVTAQPGGLGLPFITAYPTGQNRPNASILNAFQGQIVTNTAVVPAGTNGSIDVYAFGNRTDVIVEISGYFGR